MAYHFLNYWDRRLLLVFDDNIKRIVWFSNREIRNHHHVFNIINEFSTTHNRSYLNVENGILFLDAITLSDFTGWLYGQRNWKNEKEFGRALEQYFPHASHWKEHLNGMLRAAADLPAVGEDAYFKRQAGLSAPFEFESLERMFRSEKSRLRR